MIIDYSKMKELEDKIGNYSSPAPRNTPELLNKIIVDVIADCEIIEKLIEDSNELKLIYKETTDKK